MQAGSQKSVSLGSLPLEATGANPLLFPVSKAAFLGSWTSPSSFKTNSIAPSNLSCLHHIAFCLTLISTLVTMFGAHPDNPGSCPHFRILNLVPVFILFCHVRPRSRAPVIRRGYLWAPLFSLQ